MLLEVRESDIFEREGQDLFVAVPVSPAVAALVARLRARFDDWCAHKTDFERQELSVPQTGDWSKAAATDLFYIRGSTGRTPPEHSRGK